MPEPLPEEKIDGAFLHGLMHFTIRVAVDGLNISLPLKVDDLGHGSIMIDTQGHFHVMNQRDSIGQGMVYPDHRCVFAALYDGDGQAGQVCGCESLAVLAVSDKGKEMQQAAIVFFIQLRHGGQALIDP